MVLIKDKDRNQIIGFLHNRISKKTRKISHTNSKPIILSPTSKEVIQSLYDQIANVPVPKTPFTIEDIPSNAPDTYIPKEIQQIIHEHPKISKRAAFQIGERQITVDCIIPLYKENRIFENPQKANAFFETALSKIHRWLSVAYTFAPDHCSKTLHIYFYMTLEPKELPTIQNTHITQTNANTAFTTSCAPSTEINIYRKEEWFKVLIHETFHSLGLDFSAMNTAKVDRTICSAFHIRTDIRLYETFCEMWAEIIHLLFYLYVEKKVEPAKLIKEFSKCIQYETLFSVFQSTKILHFFGIRYRDLFIDSANTVAKYKASTSVFSYYVLKSIAMVYINDFIEWCHPNVLFFEKTEENMDSYAEFFVSHSQDATYLNYVATAERMNNKVPRFMKKTMRMTVYG